VRRTLAATCAGLLLLAACSGDGSQSSDTSGGGGAPESAAGAPVATEVTGAKVRFVNLFREDGEGVPVDVWWGTVGQALPEKALTVPYGEASEYVVPVRLGPGGGAPGDESPVSIVYTREGEPVSAFLVSEEAPLRDGDQVTLLVGRGEDPPSAEHPGFTNTLVERSSWRQGLAPAVPDAALVFANNAAVVFSEGSDGDAAISQLGRADGTGCLFQEQGDDPAVGQWGTTIEPGVEVADFAANGRCDETPVSDAFTTGAAGTRVVVYPFNDGTARRLLVLDVPS
jgi:hypothetical protein